ncbi:MAG TPA: twin-arginine translocase TatA/TatE family subunit [Candidatus Sumerlaeota bacterium]|jgi:sec-independent protein translocase protein TatA|nr:MAG: Sec-independent protein translocase protein TatAy [candidate division BRC1 bacterium ADurb.Bin183]HOE64098.1 twin-arginine translocase TatA/TatE family subunit [Candidatus Sumerlaeota bacterium]HRR31108.1 twin-arginine translocase TatA/TatE family subunit [Candidatus Sumerlaeia bacterium]HON51331.1 twin-arginine translocase TatA/TatE family subunit [Candidatus Sumerlaeota bacterium]HOR65709.1 twin-arginine translocase TatA/TatE family subunit [Candidatus Sumerlaeota bacterium]
MLGSTEVLVIVVLVVLLLFGPKKIPELMRGLGTGMREFKRAVKGDLEDDAEQKKTDDKK